MCTREFVKYVRDHAAITLTSYRNVFKRPETGKVQRAWVEMAVRPQCQCKCNAAVAMQITANNVIATHYGHATNADKTNVLEHNLQCVACEWCGPCARLLGCAVVRSHLRFPYVYGIAVLM